MGTAPAGLDLPSVPPLRTLRDIPGLPRSLDRRLASPRLCGLLHAIGPRGACSHRLSLTARVSTARLPYASALPVVLPFYPLPPAGPTVITAAQALCLVGCAADSTLPPRAYTRPATLRRADPTTHAGAPPPLCASPHPTFSGDAVSLRSTTLRRGWCKGTLDLRSNRDLALVPTLAHQPTLGHIASGHPSPMDCLGP